MGGLPQLQGYFLWSIFTCSAVLGFLGQTPWLLVSGAAAGMSPEDLQAMQQSFTDNNGSSSSTDREQLQWQLSMHQSEKELLVYERDALVALNQKLTTLLINDSLAASTVAASSKATAGDSAAASAEGEESSSSSGDYATSGGSGSTSTSGRGGGGRSSRGSATASIPGGTGHRRTGGHGIGGLRRALSAEVSCPSLLLLLLHD